MESIHGVPQLPDLNDFVLLPEKRGGGGDEGEEREKGEEGGIWPKMKHFPFKLNI